MRHEECLAAAKAAAKQLADDPAPYVPFDPGVADSMGAFPEDANSSTLLYGFEEGKAVRQGQSRFALLAGAIGAVGKEKGLTNFFVSP